MKPRMNILSALLLSCLLFFAANVANADNQAVISLIIDDVGNNPDMGLAALQLPGELVYAFLPNTPYATMLAEIAHEKGKQVMLHIPMESEHHKRLGPNGLKANMTEQEYKATIHHALTSVPYTVGLNNHMGSLLTQQPQPMKWLMDVLLEKKLFFLDSRTTEKTIAHTTATAMGVQSFHRDVFLDNSRVEKDIIQQFERLIFQARRKGYATGIAHPYPETIAVLRQQLPSLQSRGVKLVFASQMIKHYIDKQSNTEKRSQTWAVSSSPSHKVAKNLKQ